MVRGIAALLLIGLGSFACAGGTISRTSDGTAASLMTGDAGETTEDLDVDIEQMNAPMMMAGFTTVDVKFEVAVKNRTQTPVTIEHIALQSVGAGDYQIPPRSRPFHKTIAPGAEQKFEFWATAQVGDTTIGTKAPLTLRAMLTLKDVQGKRTESFVRRVNGRVAVGISG